MTGKSFDKNAYDRVCIISAADLGRQDEGGFDPLHPVYYRTEGDAPFTYANRFCRMQLAEDGSVQIEQDGVPERFAAEWDAMISEIRSWRTLTDLRIYDFDFIRPPVAVALTTYGRVRLHGEYAPFLRAAEWQGIRRICWDVDGFGALGEDDVFHAVGSMAALDGTDEVEEAACSTLPGHCSPVAYLLQKNGSVSLFDRKNHTVTRPRERVQQIALVRYNPSGVSTWVALSKITGRFLCSEPRDSISADYFGGDYTDIIAPNRYRQKIRSIAAVPRRYLAVLYENSYLRVFGAGYHSGDILCEDVQGMELEGEELIVYLPSDLSYAPAIEFEEGEEELAPTESCVQLGDPVDLSGIFHLLQQRIEGWQQAERTAIIPPAKKILTTRRNRHYIYFLYEDGTTHAELLAPTGHSAFGENAVEDWQGIAEILPGEHQTLGLCRDGTVRVAGHGYGAPYAVEQWDNITALRQSSGLAAGLRGDGTVVALHADTNLPLEGVEQWRDMIQIEAGDDFLLGLRRDGTVAAAGGEESIRSGVRDWQEITQIAATAEAAAGLTRSGTVVSCREPRYLRYTGMEDWHDIVSLISFRNGGSIFLGLDRAGEVHLSGRWNTTAFSYEDHLDRKKWTHLRRIWQEGYYLLGEKEDGTVIYESTPAERPGDPPMDEHITDWGSVTDWIIGGEYLLATFRDGTVAWEGSRRRSAKRRITTRWREIRQCLLWSIDGGRSNAMAVDRAGHLFSDMTAPGAEEFFGGFSGVEKICVFLPFLLVLHAGMLSFVIFEEGALHRYDLPGVQQVLMAEEGRTAVVIFSDGRVRSFGQTLFDSNIDFDSANVKFYGDRSDYIENDTDPFCHFEGIIGLQPDGRPFVLSLANRKASEHFYSVQDLMYFDTIEDAVDVQPLGDLLLADGTCRSKRGEHFAKWVGIMQLSSCFTHTVGVTTFHTVVVHGDGEYGSCSVDAYMDVAEAFSLPHATVLRMADGRLISLCEKLSETPYEPLPATKEVAALGKTASHFVILCRDGSLWCCEAQAFADKIRWRGSSEYYTRPWGPWKKLFCDATRIAVIGESIRVWRHDDRYSYMEPTLERETLSGREPTLL